MAKSTNDKNLALGRIENHLLTSSPGKHNIQECVSKGTTRLALSNSRPNYDVICKGLDGSLGGQDLKQVIKEDEKKDQGKEHP